MRCNIQVKEKTHQHFLGSMFAYYAHCPSPDGFTQPQVKPNARMSRNEFVIDEEEEERHRNPGMYLMPPDDFSMETSTLLEEELPINERTMSVIGDSLHVPRNSVCGNLSVNSSQSFETGKSTRKSTRIVLENPNLFARALSEKLAGPWIEHAFERFECIKFIPQPNAPDRCGCGRVQPAHSQLALSRFFSRPYGTQQESSVAWNISDHTNRYPTDAFGTIVFQGGAHAHKAQYVRLGYDSSPSDIMYLMEKVWGLQPPRLVITVHGGMTNFQVQEKIGRRFREGLLKAAQTTGAWILTGGLDSGVVKHVAQALDEAGISARMRSKIVTIGFAPWGILKRRERLIARDELIPYDSHSFDSPGGVGILNDRHSYFLLADNGTCGRQGADLYLRQNFENFLASRSLGERHVPVVCALLEGGTNALKAVHDYVVKDPDIPVIVCDGSGRASDLLSLAARYVDSDGSLPDEIKEELRSLIATTFSNQNTAWILQMISECVCRSDLLTIFRLGESKMAVDHAILTAVLRGHNLSLPEQLSLTLAWNRVDVARSCLFSGGNSWQLPSLHAAMNEALKLNQVEFVELLLENGVSMKNFLTITQLEMLYNEDEDWQHSIKIFLGHSETKANTIITLPEIGLIVEKLLGSAFKHYYTSRAFKSNYDRHRKKAQLTKLGNFHIRLVAKSAHAKRRTQESRDSLLCEPESRFDFDFPFNDLMLWAILTRRPEMAHCMWLHGEDAMAKGLVAIRLYKSIARIAEEEYLDVEVAHKLIEHAEEFRNECHLLLDYCYREDHGNTLKLLTAALPHWGQNNCLSLAVMANNKQFLAHPCCQMLLAELWHGALRVRSGSNMRVIMALLCPPAIFTLAFKTPRVPKVVEETAPVDEENFGTMSSTKSSKVDDKCSSEKEGSRALSISRLMSTNRSIKCRSNGATRSDDEMDGLLDVGVRKKVTIMSSKKNSTVFFTEPVQEKEELPTLTKYAKIRAFYSAPIVKFWSWCLAFHIFLLASTYVLLIETPLKPTDIEWATLVYISVYMIEHIRKLCCQEQPKFWRKCHMFYSRLYNVLTLFALLLFLIGFAFRLNPELRHSYGRVILSVSNVLWYIKVLEYLSVHPLLGPYIQMAAKMVVSMCYIIVLLLVTLMAFGVNRQAITYPHEKWNWLLVRNIFYKPYFMLYGEVYATEIDTCGDEVGNLCNGSLEGSLRAANCVPGGWIPPLLMTAFLLVANILLINMLIAIFNSIFNETNVRSKEVWLYQRYGQIMDYDHTPLLPPPFTLLSHFIILLKLCSQCCKKLHNIKNEPQQFLDFSMKLHVNPEELRELHDFEEDCMDELTRKKLSKGKAEGDDHLATTLEQSELHTARIGELIMENFSLRSRLGEIEHRLQGIGESKNNISYQSTHSLPETNSLHKSSISKDPSQFFDQPLLLGIEARRLTPSPMLTQLKKEHLVRLYDESPLATRRRRLNSSSLSMSQDMREMTRGMQQSSMSSPSFDEEQSTPWSNPLRRD